MKRLSLAVVMLVVLACAAAPAHSFDTPILAKERDGDGPPALVTPCRLTTNLTGDCANYRWYNICSGYIWLYDVTYGEGVGVLFGGSQQPCVAPGNRIERVITYYRNVCPNLGYRVNLFLDRDNTGDGCPDGVLANAVFEPAIRWNCTNIDMAIPSGVSWLIVREVAAGSANGHCLQFATDGPFTQVCDPLGAPRSFYYGINGNACVPWVGPTGRRDNFLTWLVVDSGTTATEQTSWGQIKGLYR